MAYWIFVLVAAYLIAMGRQVLFGICDGTPTAEIHGSTGLYVRRWHLVWREKQLVVVLHRFFGTDLDPPHNHSGVSLSVVLGGRGVETYYHADGRVLKTRKRRGGQIVLRTQRDIHRLDSDPSHPLTSLFMVLPHGLPWGFFTKDGFIEGTQYAKKYKADKRFEWINKPVAKS